MAYLKTCSFTGHRPSKFHFKYNEKHQDCLKIKELLQKAIIMAIEKGHTRFVSGMALGVDTWSAEIVIKLKEQFPHVTLEAAIPCLNQEKKWPKNSQIRYKNILKQTDKIVHVTRKPYNPSLMQKRNDYMIDVSAGQIAVFDGAPGGTMDAFNTAKLKGLEIIQIDPTNFFIKTIEPQIPKKLPDVLECSSKGDKRFSALHAKVSVFNQEDTIENHYQLVKRFGDKAPKTWKEAKGKPFTHVEINNKKLDKQFITQWYKLLWTKYLDENPGLAEYARLFKDYNDIFKGNSYNCQADVIRKYVKEGRKAIIGECQELVQYLK